MLDAILIVPGAHQAHVEDLPQGSAFVGVSIGIGIAFEIGIPIGQHFDFDADSDRDSEPGISQHQLYFQTGGGAGGGGRPRGLMAMLLQPSQAAPHCPIQDALTSSWTSLYSGTASALHSYTSFAHSASIVSGLEKVMQVNGDTFVDYYDLMQVSPNADHDTIQRIFRHLAQKWHPDHQNGDPDRFKRLVDAHKILSDPEARAAYDVKYQKFWETKWQLAVEASGGRGFIEDKDVRERMLSLYYVERRSRMQDPGLGEMEVARLLGIPIELIDFHIWYLKEKGWIQRLENGQLAITAPGVDQVEKGRLRLSPDRLIAAHGSGHDGDGGKPESEPVQSLPAQEKDGLEGFLDFLTKLDPPAKT